MGYGYPITYQMSCPLIADMFHHMDDIVSGYRYALVFVPSVIY